MSVGRRGRHASRAPTIQPVRALRVPVREGPRGQLRSFMRETNPPRWGTRAPLGPTRVADTSFKVEISGSNPLGGTPAAFEEGSRRRRPHDCLHLRVVHDDLLDDETRTRLCGGTSAVALLEPLTKPNHSLKQPITRGQPEKAARRPSRDRPWSLRIPTDIDYLWKLTQIWQSARPVAEERDDRMNEPGKGTSPVTTPLATLSRPAPGHLAVSALLAAVAIGVAGCYNPAIRPRFSRS